jgi:hypothetical protein
MYSLNPEPVAVEGKKIKKINVRDNDATGWISKKGWRTVLPEQAQNASGWITCDTVHIQSRKEKRDHKITSCDEYDGPSWVRVTRKVKRTTREKNSI